MTTKEFNQMKQSLVEEFINFINYGWCLLTPKLMIGRRNWEEWVAAKGLTSAQTDVLKKAVKVDSLYPVHFTKMKSRHVFELSFEFPEGVDTGEFPGFAVNLMPMMKPGYRAYCLHRVSLVDRTMIMQFHLPLWKGQHDIHLMADLLYTVVEFYHYQATNVVHIPRGGIKTSLTKVMRSSKNTVMRVMNLSEDGELFVIDQKPFGEHASKEVCDAFLELALIRIFAEINYHCGLQQTDGLPDQSRFLSVQYHDWLTLLPQGGEPLPVQITDHE